MPEFWFNDGTPRKAREIYFNDGTAVRKIKEAWFNDGTAVRKVFSATGAVDSFSPWNLVDVGYPNATAQIVFKPDGTVTYYLLNGSGYSTFGSDRWLKAGEPNTGDYYVRASLASGDPLPFSSPTGTWLSLNGEYMWQQSVGAAVTQQSSMTFEIAQESTSNIVLTALNNILKAEGHYATLVGGTAAAVITTSGAAQATLRVSSIGVVSAVVAPGGTNTIPTQASGANGSHYVRVTPQYGFVAGPAGWVQVSTAPQWYVSRAAPGGLLEDNLYLEISKSPGGAVVAAATYTLSARYQPG